MSKRNPTAADLAVQNAKSQARWINALTRAIWAAQKAAVANRTAKELP